MAVLSIPEYKDLLPGKLQGIGRVFSARITYHLLFWFCIFLFSVVYLGYVENDWLKNAYAFFIRLPFLLLLAYFNLYYLIPKYYYPDQKVSYVLLVVSAVLLTNFLNLTVLNLLLQINSCPVSYEGPSQFTMTNYLMKLFFPFAIVGITSGLKLSKHYQQQKQRIEAIEREKLATELSLLRSQIQPHFFFNTLNNIYALTLKKSDEAPEVVLKLSELMSYVLYEAQSEEAQLSKEVEHMRHYIALESLRFGKQLNVDFSINGTIGAQHIPPLLLLPFVENAFKHGTKQVLGNVEITIKLTILPQSLSLIVENPLPDSTGTQRAGGLGLKNVKRRLDLLYGEGYELFISDSNSRYTVALQIPLQ